jgi:hypothetical protein
VWCGWWQREGNDCSEWKYWPSSPLLCLRSQHADFISCLSGIARRKYNSQTADSVHVTEHRLSVAGFSPRRRLALNIIRADNSSVHWISNGSVAFLFQLLCPRASNRRARARTWIVGKLLPDYTAQHLRRQTSSYSLLALRIFFDIKSQLCHHFLRALHRCVAPQDELRQAVVSTLTAAWRPMSLTGIYSRCGKERGWFPARYRPCVHSLQFMARNVDTWCFPSVCMTELPHDYTGPWTSSVGNVTGCGLDDWGSIICSAGTLLRPAVGPTQPHSRGHKVLFTRGKVAGAWSSLHSDAEVCKAWNFTSTPPYVFMAWYWGSGTAQPYRHSSIRCSISRETEDKALRCNAEDMIVALCSVD